MARTHHLVTETALEFDDHRIAEYFLGREHGAVVGGGHIAAHARNAGLVEAINIVVLGAVFVLLHEYAALAVVLEEVVTVVAGALVAAGRVDADLLAGAVVLVAFVDVYIGKKLNCC